MSAKQTPDSPMLTENKRHIRVQLLPWSGVDGGRRRPDIELNVRVVGNLQPLFCLVFANRTTTSPSTIRAHPSPLTNIWENDAHNSGFQKPTPLRSPKTQPDAPPYRILPVFPAKPRIYPKKSRTKTDPPVLFYTNGTQQRWATGRTPELFEPGTSEVPP